MSKSKAKVLVVPSDRVAARWQDFYWPNLAEGMMLKDVDFDLLSGNILAAILRDDISVMSFWWIGEQGANIYAIGAFSITRDVVTGMRIMNIYGLVSCGHVKPVQIKAGIEILKDFKKRREVDRLVATVANKEWADLLLRLEPGFKSIPTLILEK